MAVVHVICDLPPGTRRNTYLPPEPTKGYNYDTPRIPFSKPTTSRPTFSSTTPYPNTPRRPYPSPKPSTKFPPSRPTPGEGYPPPGPRPTPEFPDYGTPTGPSGNTIPPGGVSKNRVRYLASEEWNNNLTDSVIAYHEVILLWMPLRVS